MINRRTARFYVGATTDLARRVREHRIGAADGFTKLYGLQRLVYSEWHDRIFRRQATGAKHLALAARLEAAANREE